MKPPVLVITHDADFATLKHSVALFGLLGGGLMGMPLRRRMCA
jgi:hypothetical protein